MPHQIGQGVSAFKSGQNSLGFCEQFKCVENGLVIIRKSDLAAGISLFKTEADTAGITPYNDTAVQLPLSSVNGTARWFEYNLTGTVMRLFAVADANGTVHAALDNCPKCYKKHAGFRQEGAVMVENCCNMPFSIDNITAAGCNRTGCRPAFLPTTIDGPRILIFIADLEAGRYLFQ